MSDSGKLRPRTFIGPDGPPITRMVRQFETTGKHWTVYEDESGPTLVFESEGIARRVRDYPANWRDLPDDALYALSWSK